MAYENVYIPYGAYWSTPFCRWQGSFSTLHPLTFAAETATRVLAERGIPTGAIDGFCLGLTVASPHSFYGGPWVAALMGMPDRTGPVVSQACATSVRALAYGAQQVELGDAGFFLALTADRTSNGPHIYYPDPSAPGGTGKKEDLVLDSFGHDPWARHSMTQTAENVAKQEGIGREEQDAVTLLRHGQYQEALKEDAAFHRRYMVTPLEVKDPSGRKVLATVEGDEGVFPTTAEGLEKLRPVLPEGSVTYGTQTFPADGNAGVILCRKEQAGEFGREEGVMIRVLGHGQARAPKGFMPMANAPAVRAALSRAGVGLDGIDAITTHTPFAVNDIYLSRELGIDLERMNRYGCSLIWGHPQAPTGIRSIIELIEELALRGGGRGLFTGCAAGDTAAALVLEVTVD